MKTILVVIYAATLPPATGPRIAVTQHVVASRAECQEKAALMVKRARAGDLRAFCMRVQP